jgi:hypothetical protein
MAKANQTNSVTDKNLDRLTHFLMNEIEQSSLAAQIPNGAHLFHGAYDDMELTYANIKMATAMLIEMALGICEEAPLVMIFEYKSGQQTVIDLATEERKRKTQEILESFQMQSRQEMVSEINELLAA